MSDYPTITIRKGREKSLQRFHPWVFSGSIHSASRELEEGELVRLLDHQGGYLGTGHCATGSIAVKVLTYQEEDIDGAWYQRQLMAALERRKTLHLPNNATNCFRLVHGEGDALPGLIIDIYNDVAVMQFHSKGMELALDHLREALHSMGYTNLVVKPTGGAKAEVVAGTVDELVRVKESALQYAVDVLRGQKTGFFLDQRDNRSLIEQYAKDKRVLNAFSYTGGFSLAALKGGAAAVDSLDSAAKALDIAEQNVALNQFDGTHRIVKADAVPYLESLTTKYDIIVLDPPAFAKHKSARHNAIQAYRRINEAAIKNINDGGILFTFSCSQVVDRQLFYDTVASAAMNAGRRARVIHHLRQPADHPVSIFHPEGEYLKGLALMID